MAGFGRISGQLYCSPWNRSVSLASGLTLVRPLGHISYQCSFWVSPERHCYQEAYVLPRLKPRDCSQRDEWFVTNGVVAEGPVPFDAVLRGMAGNRISRASLLRHVTWSVWRRIDELETLTLAERAALIVELASWSAGIAQRACARLSEPPPPASAPQQCASSTSAEITRRSSVRPAAVNPVGVMSQSRSLDEALLLTLSTSIMAASAHLGLVCRVTGDGQGAITVAAQGQSMEAWLGCYIGSDDPTLEAARRGRTILGENPGGPVTQRLMLRLGHNNMEPLGVAMVPVRRGETLLAWIELAQLWRPFSARELGRVEDVADALVERVVVQGWLDQRETSPELA